MSAPDLIIVGGGIGGLTLALALHEAGITTRIYESSDSLEELGVGINILPHATKEYERLGILPALLENGVSLERYIWFNRFGQEIFREARGLDAGYAWPQVSIHRGRFQRILRDEVHARLGPEAIVLDHHLRSLADDGDRVTATFVSKRHSTVQPPVDAAAVVAADGIHSVARRMFYPQEGPPRWAGNMMWRMTVALDAPVLGGATMFSAGTGDIKVVGYEISAQERRRGASLFNWIAELKLGDAGSPPPEREDWNRRAAISEFVDRFSSWRFSWLDIPALARKAGHAWAFPMVDRDPLERWTFGRITLLGDAAHPMWPIGSNGASQAVLDCRALTDALVTHGDYAAAFAAYEAARRPATAAVVHANRQRAHDAMLDLVDARAPTGFERIEDVIARTELEEIVASYRHTAHFDRTQLQR